MIEDINTNIFVPNTIKTSRRKALNESDETHFEGWSNSPENFLFPPSFLGKTIHGRQEFIEGNEMTELVASNTWKDERN